MAGSGRRIDGLDSRLSDVALAFCVAVSITLVGYAIDAATHRPSTLLKILIPMAFFGPAVESSLQFVLFGALNCAAWTVVLYAGIAWRKSRR